MTEYYAACLLRATNGLQNLITFAGNYHREWLPQLRDIEIALIDDMQTEVNRDAAPKKAATL